MKSSDSFLLREKDQTCSTTDDLTSNEFEQPPQKTKTTRDGLCQGQKSLAYFQKQ